jgi:hypothetical protein
MEDFVKLFTTRIFNRISLLFLLSAVTLNVACEKDVKELTIRVRSRVYMNFREDHKVKMYQKFSISDTDMEAVVVEFIPDFAIDTLTHKAISRSDTLNNPAAKVLIIQGGDKKEEVWAFRPGMLPHFSPKSFVGFELLDVKAGGKYKEPAMEKLDDEKKDD